MGNSETDPVLLIVAPTPQEFAAVKKGLSAWSTGKPVRLVSCGVGVAQASRFCQGLDPERISGLVLIGWAGGISTILAAGDVVFAESANRYNRPPVLCKPVSVSGAKTGPILTVSDPLLSQSDKAAAQAAGIFAVEMEAYPFAAWAESHHIPFYHVRVILDAWNEPLPDFGKGIDASGKPQAGNLLKEIVRQPKLIQKTWWLFRRVRAVDPILTRMATDLKCLIE